MKRGVMAIALAVAATAALAVKPLPPEPLVKPLAWYDSTGKLVGNQLGDGALARIDGLVLFVLMRPAYPTDANAPIGAHVLASTGTLYFTDLTCSTRPYMRRTDVPGTTRFSVVQRPQESGVIGAAYGYATPVATTVTLQSKREGDPATCSAYSATESLFPAELGVNYSEAFTPPFYLK